MKLRFILFATVVLFLSGCYAQDTLVRVNGDGSGTVEVHAGINKTYDQLVNQPGEDEDVSPAVEDIVSAFQVTIEDQERFPRQWQPKVSPWDDGTYQGAKLELQFANTAVLQQQLTTLLEEAQTSGYSEIIVSLSVEQNSDRIQIKAPLVGVPFDDGGEPLPGGPEGTGRVTWSVTLPQMEACQPSRFATCANNQANWNIPFNGLQQDEQLELVTSGRLQAATGTPTTLPTTVSTPVPPAATPTSQPATPVPATTTPTRPPPTVANALTSTSTPQSNTAAPTELAGETTLPNAPETLPAPTTPPGGTSGPVWTSPAVSEAVSPTSASNATVQPRATPATGSPLDTAPAGNLAATVANTAPTNTTASTSVVSASAPTEQAFMPIVADASVANDPALNAGVAAPTTGRSGRPALPYRNSMIVACLLGAAGCLGYVGFRKLQRRRAESMVAQSPTDTL